MSTDPNTSRKMTPMTSRQKYVQCSTEEKGTISGMTMSSEKHYMESIQGFDSDSLLTINKTSTEEYGTSDDNYNKKVNAPLNTKDTHKIKHKLDNGAPKRLSRPLSLELSSKSLRRSKDYYSDSDCAIYFSDSLSEETSPSNNEIGSRPKLQTEKGHVVKLGRCKICSNDCYHMVCIGNEDEFTLDSFESAEPMQYRSFTVTESTDDPQTSSTYSRARISFDESILTGFLRDEHPNPKIISHRWTHIPYMREKDIETKDFMTESTSCDDRFLSSRQVDEKVDKKETVEEPQCLQKPDKPVGLVSPLVMVSTPMEQRGDIGPPVASVESIEELNEGCDSTYEHKCLDQQNIYDQTDAIKIDQDSLKDNQNESRAVVTNTVDPLQNCSFPSTWHTTVHTIQYQDLPNHPLYTCESQSDAKPEAEETISNPQSPTVSRREMAAIKEGIVKQLGQVYETKFLILHPVTDAEIENTEKTETKTAKTMDRKEKQHKRGSKLLPGKVKFLRAIFEDPAN